jgi:hypothetical protein
MILYPFFVAFRKLSSVVGGMLCVFVVLWVLGRIGTCIGK